MIMTAQKNRFSQMSDSELHMWIAKKLGWGSVAYREYKNGRYVCSGIEPGFVDVPDWLNSVDAALTLIDRNLWNIELEIGFEMSEATLDDLARTYWAKAEPDRLARAICEVWCIMMEDSNNETE